MTNLFNFLKSLNPCAILSFLRLLGVVILLAQVASIITEIIYIENDDQNQTEADSRNDHTLDVLQVIDLVFSAYYGVEVSLRIIGNG